MSLPLGVPRRAFSYDDALEDTAPMTPPPADLCASVLWKQPVIPERKYQELSKVRARLASACPWVPRSSGAPLLASPFSQASAPRPYSPPACLALPPCPRSRTLGRGWGLSLALLAGPALGTRRCGCDKHVLSGSSVFVVKKKSSKQA